MPKEPLTEISKTLEKSEKVKKQVRDTAGKFVSIKNAPVSDKANYPPMVSVTVANPVTYLKLWWKKVMQGEGIDVRFRIHPITAIILALIICGAGFGLGRLTFPADSTIVKYVPKLGPSPTESPDKEAAYTGVVQRSSSTGKYYLLSAGGGVVSLSFPQNINAEKLLGKRILAVGRYNLKEDILYVIDASDLEILPLTPTPVPTVLQLPTPTESLNPEPSPNYPPPGYIEEPTI